MGRIAAHEFVSLDGVFDNPSWTAPFGFDPAMGDDIGRITSASDAILLGRNTFEMFAPAWSTRTVEEDPGAPFFNDTTKSVVTSSLEDAALESQWRNSCSLGTYDADAIRGFKDQVDGGIYISGSGQLVRALMADGLVDSLHLFVFPVVLGSGAKLFPDGMPETRLELREHVAYDNGVVQLHYAPV